MTQRARGSIHVSRPVPAPALDEPSDDELLRFLDGALPPVERARLARRIEASPYATARLEVLAAALEESGFSVDD